jgi:hypothetical protein
MRIAVACPSSPWLIAYALLGLPEEAWSAQRAPPLYALSINHALFVHVWSLR